MALSDRGATLALLLVLSLGISTVFLVASEFVFTPVFEFFGLMTLLLGWFVVVPLYLYVSRTGAEERSSGIERTTGSTVRDAIDRGADADGGDPMTILQQQYAAGDISERELERRLEHLLALEDVDLDDLADRRLTNADRSEAADPAPAPEREGEYEREFETD